MEVSVAEMDDRRLGQIRQKIPANITLLLDHRLVQPISEHFVQVCGRFPFILYKGDKQSSVKHNK